MNLKYITSIIIILFPFILLNSQSKCDYDSSYVDNGKRFEGLWAIDKFSDGSFKISTGLAGFHKKFFVLFQEENKLVASAGNGFSGRYYIADSNKIKIKYCMSTSAAFYVTQKKGPDYNPDFFADTFKICNNFIEKENLLEFYDNDKFVLSLKPILDFFQFPQRDRCTDKNFVLYSFDSANLKQSYFLINNQNDLDSLGVDLKIDFASNSLLLIRNTPLFENEFVLKQMTRKEKKSYCYVKYPCIYTKFYFNPVDNKYYLDIYKTYFKGLNLNTRTGYSAYLIEKVQPENFNINIQHGL